LVIPKAGLSFLLDYKIVYKLSSGMEPLTNLKEWRERRGLSQRELSALTGVHQISIHRLETGQLDPQLSTLRKLCAALHITPNQLLGVAKKPQKGR